MSIRSDFALSLIKPYLPPLLLWLSDHIYIQLFSRRTDICYSSSNSNLASTP